MIAGAFAVSGCGSYPRDIENTTERIFSSRTIRTGIVSDDLSKSDRVAVDRFLAALAQRTGTRVVKTKYDTEASMIALNEAHLDLIVGTFADDTPWRNEVAVSEPLRHGQTDQKAPVVRAVVRNGENRWVMTVEQVIRDQNGGV